MKPEPARSRPPRDLDPAEITLVTRLRAEDEGALAAFEERYGRVLTGFLRDSLPDPGTAEEVRQQVLTEIWRRGADYDPARSSILTWALMIARSRAADERRRRRPTPIDPTTIEESGEDPELDGLLDRWRVAALLERIPAGEAGVLRLRFYEGLSQSEIAARTGVPLGTVKTRMIRGLARLRELIAEEGVR
ncbi:MAG: sigma-70 family RNA polymerase sigma factor [Actinobacteria bacterium]|nr:sigma-70 family RNA polymerase sigma factor [Actinomycetota bacterium]